MILLSIILGTITAASLGVATWLIVSWRKSITTISESRASIEMEKSLRESALFERDKAQSDLKIENNLRIEAEKSLAALRQEILSIQREMDNKKKSEEEAQKNAESAMFKAGSCILKKEVEDINKKYEQIVNNVLHIQDNMKDLEKMRQALLTPQGAGYIGEIALENILKSSGLEPDRDYKMQYWVSGEEKSGLKPDAVVFMPDNIIAAIDSKASKFFQELGEADGDLEKEKALEKKLKASMNQHLKDLIKRDYRNAIEEQLQHTGNIHKPKHVHVLMFLPTEQSLERLRKIDNEFLEKAWQKDIQPVGPHGLLNILTLSKMIISSTKQEQHSRMILFEVKNLLTTVAKLHGYADSLGKSIKSTSKKYDEFAASFNAKFLSKARKVVKLGIEMPKKTVFSELERYQLVESHSMIEGESEELEELEPAELEDNSA